MNEKIKIEKKKIIISVQKKIMKNEGRQKSKSWMKKKKKKLHNKLMQKMNIFCKN